MVNVYTTLSNLQKHIGKNITKEEIIQTLIDLGMDVKGETNDIPKKLKIEITAEKMDMVSEIGIARAISYYKEIKKDFPNFSTLPPKYKVIVKDCENLQKTRPKTCAAILRDIPNSKDFLEHIIELQEKLHTSHGRDRKKAAIGIYPLEKIKFPIFFRAELPENIKFHPLGEQKTMKAKEILEQTQAGKKYSHLLKNHTHYPIFEDSNKEILSMPPIINSEDTGKVREHHKNLFIEVSGHNEVHLDNILKIIITECIELGTKAEQILVTYEKSKKKYILKLNPQKITVSKKYINSLIGLNLNDKEIQNLASKMILQVTEKNQDKLEFKYPCFRTDIWAQSDIVDDIARAYGFNNIKITHNSVNSQGSYLPQTHTKKSIKKTLIGMGFLETYSYMLTQTNTQFTKMELEPQENYEQIKNACEQGINMLRTSLLPEILTFLTRNRKYKYPQNVFEMGETIHKNKKKETKAEEKYKLCCTIASPTSNYTKIKEIIDTLSHIHNLNLSFKRKTYSFLIEGRSAKILYKEKEIGFIGEIAPKVLSNFNLLVPLSCFEIDITEILDRRNS